MTATGSRPKRFVKLNICPRFVISSLTFTIVDFSEVHIEETPALNASPDSSPVPAEPCILTADDLGRFVGRRSGYSQAVIDGLKLKKTCKPSEVERGYTDATYNERIDENVADYRRRLLHMGPNIYRKKLSFDLTSSTDLYRLIVKPFVFSKPL